MRSIDCVQGFKRGIDLAMGREGEGLVMSSNKAQRRRPTLNLRDARGGRLAGDREGLCGSSGAIELGGRRDERGEKER